MLDAAVVDGWWHVRRVSTYPPSTPAVSLRGQNVDVENFGKSRGRCPYTTRTSTYASNLTAAVGCIYTLVYFYL